MQDRYRRIDENLLRRTAGPYIWVMNDKTQSEHNRSALRWIAPKALFGGASWPDC